MYKYTAIATLTISMFAGCYFDEGEIIPMEESSEGAISSETEFLFGDNEIGLDDYRSMIMEKIELTDLALDSKIATHNRNSISSEPNVDAFLSDIEYLEGNAELASIKSGRKIEGLISIGHEESEVGPLAIIDVENADFRVDNRIIPPSRPYIERDYENENRMLISDLRSKLAHLGVNVDTDVEIVPSSIVATELKPVKNEDAQMTKREYLRTLRVHRIVNGRYVDGNGFNVTYTVDGRLKKLAGHWDRVDYIKTQFDSDISEEDVIGAVTAEIIDKEIDPFQISRIKLAPAYKVIRNSSRKGAQGQLNMILKAMILSEDGAGNASGIILDVDI